MAYLRKALEIKKIGHSGTLDPLATGVLIVGINNATRLFEYLPSDKEYIADIVFGIRTNTDDISGEIIKKENHIPSLQEIEKTIKQFVGKIKQKPPIFSAINIKGERAYSLARKNEISLDNIKEKIIEIYSMEIISFNKNQDDFHVLRIKVHCSSGTYIRSIARDLGNILNSAATLYALTRTAIGEKFKIKESLDLKDLSQENFLNHLTLPQDAVSLDKLYFTENQINDIKQGKKIKIGEVGGLNINKEVQILDRNDKVVGIVFVDQDYHVLPKKILVTNG